MDDGQIPPSYDAPVDNVPSTWLFKSIKASAENGSKSFWMRT